MMMSKGKCGRKEGRKEVRGSLIIMDMLLFLAFFIHSFIVLEVSKVFSMVLMRMV
jgi:hypothetical protein